MTDRPSRSPALAALAIPTDGSEPAGVAARRERDGFERPVAGRVTDEVVHGAPAPASTVGPDAANAEPSDDILETDART